MLRCFFAFFTSFFLTMNLQAASMNAPGHLACEYLTNPIGLGETSPRLSWKLDDLRRGACQTAYQILVASDPQRLQPGQADAWDSGKVDSDQSIQIVYGGNPLSSGAAYYWKVRVWDKNGEPSPFSETAFWRMGLLNPSDWKAQWIGLPGLLKDNIPAHLGYHSQLEKNAGTPKWVMIDLGESKAVDAVNLLGVRPFYYSSQPGFLFPVRYRIDVSNDCNFADFKTVADETAADVPNPGEKVRHYGFESCPGRYVRLYVIKLARRDADNCAFALAEMEVLADGVVISKGSKASALDSIESGEWALSHLNDGVVEARRVQHAQPGPSPILRKTFKIPAAPKTATLYASALGLYEIHINGKRVGENILAPEWTDYAQRIQYQAYDVSSLLTKGDNAVGALLGEGWYAGLVGLMSPRQYGRQLGLLLQLEVECEDGSKQIIVSDPSWKASDNGPIRGSDIIRGETYDARLEIPRWDKADFDDAQWIPVQTITGVQAELSAQPNEPIRITQLIQPRQLSEPAPGVYVFDLGQNMVGWSRLKAHGDVGTKIQLRHAEVLQPDGNVYTDNLRGDFQRDVYIFNGGESVLEPHFTYHGFRYVEVTGLPYKPDPNDLTGCIFYSAAPLNGQFECSDPLLNQLMSNIVWTQRGNMHSTPTDCPQRDERLGWMGDAQVFSQAACFNMNMAAFFTKWLRDVREAQSDDGRFSDFSPNPSKSNGAFLASPAWADAGVIVPWRMYENYGDVRILERHFDAARRWVEYVRLHSPGLIWSDGRGNDYGDWLNGDTLILDGWPKKGADIPREILATAFFAHSTDILSKMAKVIGKEKEAQEYGKLAQEIKSAFCQKYLQPDGRIESNTQSAYALALHFRLIPDSLREAALRHLLEGIETYSGRLSTGIQTTNRMMLELADEGRSDIAYRLLTSREIPSWGYMIDHGATTIWERWDGWVDGRGFQNKGMNSFNHYAIGAVGEWMYRCIAGINPDPEIPAFKRFILHPRFGGGLTWAKAKFDSPYGEISSSWKIENGVFAYDAVVPPNSEAIVYIPASDVSEVKVSGKSIKDRKDIHFLEMKDGCVVLSVKAGSYRFEVKFAK
ncbi:MAG: family 78 glycoside hydrolase catalytic domain [Candidatus Omnitrophota bacterium]